MTSLAGYAGLLEDIKTRLRVARLRAAVSVNRELMLLYWWMGNEILRRQRTQGWGAKVIERLSRDLKAEFPDMRGLSSRNLKYMQRFAAVWPDEAIVQRVVAQLGWGQNIALLDRTMKVQEREWYAVEAAKYGWSRPVLTLQIDSDLYGRQGKAVTNFSRTLPPAQSDMAQALLKDPYSLEFLGLGGDADERVVESGLLGQLQRFLLEFGSGFSFVGRQARLLVGGDEFFIDLLFYHLRLRCFVVVELKAGAFKPEHAGKLNFYLAAVDDQFRHPEDRPSIGIILCREKNSVVVEYSLRAMGKPIGVATYMLTKVLPREIRGALPSPGELAKALK